MLLIHFWGNDGNTSLRHRVQTFYGSMERTQPHMQHVPTESSYPGGKAAGSWSWKLISVYYRS